MARVEVAGESGACYGVERALELVERVSRESTGAVHTLGPLIHNPSVVSALEEMGVTVVDLPSEAPPGATLVLRTHGVAPEVERSARDAGLTVIDATCPFVTRVHRLAEKLAADGYQVMIAGEEGHPEVEGTRGHVPGAPVVLNASDVDALEVSRRVALVVQTTLAVEELRNVVGALVDRCDELHVCNTICDATSKRQGAAAELADRADVMIVVGGKNSANTNHLADICSSRATTHHVESPTEVDPAWFSGAKLVGITAGASTPRSQVEEMREHVTRLCG